ncbi:MAG: hypothetical protein M3O34_08125 [Chloroflexota bacterium]|nr:hypothetical protein [Chloroflexota bacterium]
MIADLILPLALLVTWAYTRTLGLPYGECLGRPLQVKPTDSIPKTVELVLPAALLWLLAGQSRGVEVQVISVSEVWPTSAWCAACTLRRKPDLESMILSPRDPTSDCPVERLLAPW